MANLTFKRFDTYPPLGVTLSNASGPIDLTTASSVHMSMKAQTTGTLIASLAMASTIATAGYLKHFWTASETSMSDTWDLEWEIQWAAAGNVQTVPNSGVLTLLIEADIEAG